MRDEVGMREEWQRYWTPGEYATMQDVLTPEGIEREIVRMRYKSEHYLIALELGFDLEEAALMKVRSMIAIHERRD